MSWASDTTYVSGASLDIAESAPWTVLTRALTNLLEHGHREHVPILAPSLARVVALPPELVAVAVDEVRHDGLLGPVLLKPRLVLPRGGRVERRGHGVDRVGHPLGQKLSHVPRTLLHREETGAPRWHSRDEVVPPRPHA